MKPRRRRVGVSSRRFVEEDDDDWPVVPLPDGLEGDCMATRTGQKRQSTHSVDKGACAD